MSSPRFAREATAAVLAPIGIWINGWAHPYVFDATIALIAALALYEFLALGRHKGYAIPVTLCIAVMTCVMWSSSERPSNVAP